MGVGLNLFLTDAFYKIMVILGTSASLTLKELTALLGAFAPTNNVLA